MPTIQATVVVFPAGTATIVAPAAAAATVATAPGVTGGGLVAATAAAADVQAPAPGVTGGGSVPAEVGWIGDSLTAGMTPATVEAALESSAFTTARCDGLVGRSIINGVEPYIPSSQTVVAAWRASGYNPRTWVLALITNDEWDTNSGWTTKITTLIDLIVSVAHGSGPYRIYWVGLTYRPDLNVVEPGVSRVSRWVTVANAVAAARSDCEVIPVDWNGLIHNGRDETGLWDLGDSTGRHMTATGYTLRRTTLVPLITPPGSVAALYPSAATWPGAATYPGS